MEISFKICRHDNFTNAKNLNNKLNDYRLSINNIVISLPQKTLSEKNIHKLFYGSW